MDISFTALLNIPQQAGYYFPDRHFQHISGNSLFRLMIEKLEELDQVGSIIVNTDSRQVGTTGFNTKKVRIIDAYRSEQQETEMELTSDKVTAAMLQHAEGEHFLQLAPIFPFLKRNTIEQVMDTYISHVAQPEEDYARYNYDSVFTTRMLNRRYYDSDTDFIREDRPNTFVEDGILHAFSRTAFAANGNRKIGKAPYAVMVGEIENLAIDSEENFRIAAYIDEHRHLFPNVFGR